jgi:hypothetical protein
MLHHTASGLGVTVRSASVNVTTWYCWSISANKITLALAVYAGYQIKTGLLREQQQNKQKSQPQNPNNQLVAQTDPPAATVRRLLFLLQTTSSEISSS